MKLKKHTKLINELHETIKLLTRSNTILKTDNSLKEKEIMQLNSISFDRQKNKHSLFFTPTKEKEYYSLFKDDISFKKEDADYKDKNDFDKLVDSLKKQGIKQEDILNMLRSGLNENLGHLKEDKNNDSTKNSDFVEITYDDLFE